MLFQYIQHEHMIKKWHLKAIVQKALSILPAPEKANFWFQKNVTKGVDLTDEHLGYKVGHAKDHIAYFEKYGKPSPESKILELGTGWYPIVPTLIYLTNSGKVLSIDIQNWLTKEGMLTTIERLKEWKANGMLEKNFGKVDEDKWRKLEVILKDHEHYTLEQIKEVIGLDNKIIDARKTGIASESFDFICSNNTFEHIYPDILIAIISEFQRVLKTGGVMSHFIDMTDHFAHFDTSITVYNFLQYSKRKWSLIDNSIQPQNRLRYRDYLEIYQSLVIQIVEEEIWPKDLEALRRVNIHKEFQDYTDDELSIKHAYIISQK